MKQREPVKASLLPAALGPDLIVASLRRHERLDVFALADYTSFPQAEVQVIIDAMLAEGRLGQIGPDDKRYWPVYWLQWASDLEGET
jgi:hypothetical protein